MAALVGLFTPMAGPVTTPFMRTVQFTGDASYPTGGYSLVAADVGMTILHNVICSAPAGFVPVYDFTTGKVKLYRTGTGADTSLNEVTAAVNVSAVTFRITIIGV